MHRRLTLVVLAVVALVAPPAANAAIAPDPGYGTGGTASVALQCSGATFSTAQAGYGGRVFVLEKCTTGNYRLIALGDDGAPDPGWGTGGHVTFKVSSTCDGAGRLLPLRNGQLYVGFSANDREPAVRDLHACFAKVTSTGKLDTAFGAFGRYDFGLFRHLDRPSPSGTTGFLTGMAVDTHNRLVVFSERQSSDWKKSAAFINRFATNGSPDISFSGDGQRAYTYVHQSDLLWGGVIGDDPVIAIGVSAGPAGPAVGTAFLRFTSSGQPSSQFAGDGIRYVDARDDLGGAQVGSGSIRLDSHGAIVFAAQKGSSWIKLVRMAGTGRMDLPFNKASQKIQPTAGLIPYADLFVTAGHYLVSWATDESSAAAGFTTGFDDEGGRWTSVGPRGTANVTVTDVEPDRAAFYNVHAPSGGPIEVTRSLIQ